MEKIIRSELIVMASESFEVIEGGKEKSLAQLLQEEHVEYAYTSGDDREGSSSLHQCGCGKTCKKV